MDTCDAGEQVATRVQGVEEGVAKVSYPSGPDMKRKWLNNPILFSDCRKQILHLLLRALLPPFVYMYKLSNFLGPMCSHEHHLAEYE